MKKLTHLLSAIGGTARDVLSRAGDPDYQQLVKTALSVGPDAAKLVLPWFLKTRPGNDASLLKVVLENAKKAPHSLAVEMGDERVSWSGLDHLSSKVAHVLSDLGVGKGDVVALVGMNSPSFLVNVLATTRVGAVCALVNWHLEGDPLRHAILSSKATVVLVEASLHENITGNAALSSASLKVLTFRKGELEERMAKTPTKPFPRVPVDVASDFVYIFTSGTTGLPKPCRVSHARTLVGGGGFAALMFRFKPGDKLYCVLPLYHSSALIIGTASCFLTRTPMALREQFSASQFWPDVRRYGATATLYIGELCRYLLSTKPCDAEVNNTLRVAVGNGLRADVWQPFAERFAVPEIREFYSATEAPGAIFNITGKVGSIGHVPGRRLGALRLAKFDVDEGALIRDTNGMCVECEAGEVGQLVIEITVGSTSPLKEFRGYTDQEATRKKIATDVFSAGDRYFLSGDLLRFDENDFFYFVDRIGDTYRWKGENVSTEEVAAVIAKAPGIIGATVSSVSIPGTEGKAGLAAVICDGDLDVAGFWRTAQELPTYAQPIFVRVLREFDTTGTFKVQKSKLSRDGIDPRSLSDPLFVRTSDGYVALTAEVYDRLERQEMRL